MKNRIRIIIVTSVIILASIITVSYLHQSATSYSYDFQVQINYSGSWKLTYWGSHVAGCPPNVNGISGSYVEKTVHGNGSDTFYVTLSGPDNQGLSLSVLAEKLDASNATLFVNLNNVRQNSTSLPFGSTYSCSAVVP